RVLAAFFVRAHYLVVGDFEVPVIHQDHEYFEPIQFASSDEGVILPGPQPDVLEPIVATLEPDVHSVTAGQAVNVNSTDEVVLIRVIAHGPNDPSSYRLRSRLRPKLDSPFSILVVSGVDLFLSAFVIKSNVSESSPKVWRTVTAARTIE